MVKFNKELIMKKDTAIYCNTEEKFNLLLKWAEYEKIISESGNTQYKWSRYGKETYLDIYDDTFGNIEAYRRYDYNFLEYDDVLTTDTDENKGKKMIKFNHNKIMNENTVVHCNTKEKAIKLLEWVEFEKIWDWKYNRWDKHKENTCYNILYNYYGHIKSYSNHTILEYEDVIIKNELREKEINDKVVCFDKKQLRKGIIFSKHPNQIHYGIKYENGYEASLEKKYIWFESPNLEIKLTIDGLDVTGEIEPEIRYICPICKKEINIHHNEAGRLKELGIHQCLHNTVISVVGNTLEEVSENLYKFYNLIRDSM